MRLKLCFLVVILACVASCAYRDPICDRLFPPIRYADIYASSDIGPRPTPEPTATLPACLDHLPQLPFDIIAQDSRELGRNFVLSPSGEQMILDADHGLSLLSIATGQRIQFSVTDNLQFWIDESHVILWGKRSNRYVFYSFDILTGQEDAYEMRWEYNDLSPHLVTEPLIKGRSAQAILQVDEKAICKAVHDGRLGTVEGADSILLLVGQDLLQHGGDLIREEHPGLLNYENIAQLRQAAQSQSSLVAIPMNSPVVKAYWHRILVLAGLPNKPHNLLVHVSSESHWEGYPMIASQLAIDKEGSLRWTDPNTGFLVSRSRCISASTKQYQYILYRRDAESLTPVGLIPYVPGHLTMMAWSPDGRYIYIKQPIDGLDTISRINLN